MPLESMDLAGSKSDSKISDLCYREHNLKEEQSFALDTGGRNEVLLELTNYVRGVSRAGKPEAIFAVERAFLEHEQKHAIRTPEQGKSVTNALSELTGAEATFRDLGGNPEAYRIYAATYAIPPKNRIGDLPRDSARDFFRSQNARLTNLRKSPHHDDLTHKLYEVRRESLRGAEKTYISLQRKVLGLPAVEKGRSRGR